MTVYGLWYGGDSYSWGDPEESLERFTSIKDAQWALRDRYNSNGMRTCDFDYVNREPASVYVPCVTETSEIHLFFTEPGSDYYPDRIIKFGPKMGVRVERC